MSTVLLDASVILAAFDSDDRCHQAAAALLVDGSVTLATLDLARYEVANVAVRGWSEPGLVGQLLSALGRIEDDGGVIESSGALIARAAELSERHEIAVYDAVYVAAAEAAERTLVSCDVRDLVSKELARLP
jgi:predicted nucleic acid-binding protein